MGRDCQRQIIGLNASAVVDDAYQGNATLFECHVDARRSGIEGILEQFFYDARWPFNHLSGGNPVDNRHRQRVNPFHACDSRSGRHCSLSGVLSGPLKFLDFSVERALANAEHFSSLLAIAASEFERFTDEYLLHILKRSPHEGR